MESKECIKDEEYKLCLICMDVEGEILLCSKCKFIYCLDCAKKINNLCCICFRKNNSCNLNNMYNHPYDMNNMDDFNYYSYLDDVQPQFSRLHQYMYLFALMSSIVISFIIGICLFILCLFFGYVLFIFIFNIINHLMQLLEYTFNI